VNAFSFDLQNAISQRRDQSGADYFINAGETRQRGIETALNFSITQNKGHSITASSFWLSHTYHHFRYRNFKQLDSDYSRNRIPGVAPHVMAAGIHLETKPGIYLHATYYYSDPIALNDANSEYATPYHLLGAKLGYKRSFGEHLNADLFFCGVNYLAGVSFRFFFKTSAL
jgi:iron complex outermembrane recepter protein